MSKIKKEEQVKRAKRVFNLKERIKENKSELYCDFMELLYSNNFFNNITDDDLDYSEEHPEYGVVCDTLKSNGIEIGIYDYKDEGVLVGIDPTGCFDKTTKCSIHAWFPMSKREYTRFKLFFNKLLDPKSNTRKEWNKEAAKSWFGSYITFGK